MSDTTPETKLWSSEGFRKDDYIFADDLDVAGDAPAIIIPLTIWLELGEEQRRSSNRRIGIFVAPGEKIEPLLEHLGTIPLIALEFPAFNDGRSYSRAEVLRRAGFRGELRAVGDVLIDQAVLMLRIGFDTLQVSNHVAQARLGEHRLVDTPGYYQPGRGSVPQEGGFAWRRVKTG
ncbi:DUF934 domain-containing protein [Falsochrobactrum sp. TDYN1]|uniref:DUF934 domain-containing protein n=1 Tax=Falsochrobactrum tianjinense TaxID=2706015 RepID=A0A949UT44_9HYPH|nr:DUF934 domain-containing protein [Falsochrobactrum sp. TDYN1]MBV2142332.1 DUF934 domain-containing protein [Falsochrobactrum sp. TDYN1]